MCVNNQGVTDIGRRWTVCDMDNVCLMEHFKFFVKNPQQVSIGSLEGRLEGMLGGWKVGFKSYNGLIPYPSILISFLFLPVEHFSTDL